MHVRPRRGLLLQFMLLQFKKTANIVIQYQDFVDVFEKKNVDMLLEHRPYDCPIDLQEGAKPPFGPIYNLSENELQALRDYIDENLGKKFIC